MVALLVLEGPQRMAPRVVVKQYTLEWIWFSVLPMSRWLSCAVRFLSLSHAVI